MLDFIKKIFGKAEHKSTKPKLRFLYLHRRRRFQTTSLEISTTQVECYPPQLLVGSAQSVGRQRDHNEDTLLDFPIDSGRWGYRGSVRVVFSG